MTSESPQLENGFTRIANELFDAVIRSEFSKRELKIILLIIRKTYGFGKKTDDMTLTQIANATGLDLAHVSKAVKVLFERKVLLKRQGRFGLILGINKDYGEWITLPKQQGVAKTASEPCQNGKLTLPKQQTQKITPKETTKRNSSITLSTFLDHCRQSSEKPIQDDDPIFPYAEKVGISQEMLAICWGEFKRAYLASTKRYSDWRAHYRNAVRKNWYKLWFIRDGELAVWTTTGEQARREAA